uniref:DDE Tnp4 domain-containing protein n=2 Tax=Sipha flava TaxID=143950 RepID=A0A2S2QL55_9HEMI
MTKLIWELLKDSYMPTPTEENWKLIAQRFYSLWNLPNCLGALDGKHIRIEKLPGSGSSNFNYKMYHSIVLFACSDADGFFTTIETGYAGRNSDGGILTQSRCGAGTTSTPLSRSRVRFLPSLNPGNDNTVSDTTHLPRKIEQKWEKLSKPVATYRPVASSHQLCSRDHDRGTIIINISFCYHRHQTTYFI